MWWMWWKVWKFCGTKHTPCLFSWWWPTWHWWKEQAEILAVSQELGSWLRLALYYGSILAAVNYDKNDHACQSFMSSSDSVLFWPMGHWKNRACLESVNFPLHLQPAGIPWRSRSLHLFCFKQVMGTRIKIAANAWLMERPCLSCFNMCTWIFILAFLTSCSFQFQNFRLCSDLLT